MHRRLKNTERFLRKLKQTETLHPPHRIFALDFEIN